MSDEQIGDPEELLNGTVKEVKSALREAENPDYSKLKELEEENKNRKTLKTFLDSKIESEYQETNEEDTQNEEEGENDEETEDNGEPTDDATSSGSSSVGKEQKLQQVLDSLDEVQSVKGAAVVRRDGLLIASNLGSNTDDDRVGAMTASTVGSGETASDSLNLGNVDEVTVEAENGKLVATGAGENGVLAVLTDADVNMGLVKVEIEKATDKIRRVI